MKSRLNVFLSMLFTLTLILTSGCTSENSVYIPTQEELEAENMYKNHFILPEKPLAEVADPFIMRYNGWYYLYCTGDVNIWKSKDLADWAYVGTANRQNPLPIAFAPEVYYWNGKFYMYTSPSGNGHYIYVSDSPTGPFEKATGNLGMVLDGSAFIDDDGSWYFTRAGGNTGIIGHTMNSPLEIDIKGKELAPYMQQWTEGPMIIKRDGRYFMLFTGTHYKSDAYREKYAYSENGPLGDYVTPKENPILINNDKASRALGHACFVYGPDLDSMFIAYHSYTRILSGRVFNIDRLAFNGRRMYVNGPTLHEMPVSDLPDYALWPEDKPETLLEKVSADGMEMLLSAEKTPLVFTAEFNFTGGDGDTGVVFSKNEQSYIRMIWPKDDNIVKLEKVTVGDIELLGEFSLPSEFSKDVLHTVKVQYSPEQMDLYFDNMKKFTVENLGEGAGKIGYIYSGSKPEIGFTGFSGLFKGSSDNQSVKPVPSEFDAVHHMREEGKGFGGDVSYIDLEGDVKTVLLNKKDWVSYRVKTKEESKYKVALQVRRDFAKGTKVEVLEDGISLGEFTLEKPVSISSDQEQSYVKLPLGAVNLKEGMHILTLRMTKGKDLDVLSVEVYEAFDDDLPVFYDLTEKSKDMFFRGNKDFSFSEKGMVNSERGDIKMTVGEGSWTDYTVDVEVTQGKVTAGSSGLMIRSNNETWFQHQTIFAMQGYYVGIGKGNVFLRRMNYEDTEKPIKVEFSTKVETTYKLRVVAKGNNIQVYVDDMENPLIDYFDPYPYLNGRVGIWSYGETLFKNLKVSPLE